MTPTHGAYILARYSTDHQEVDSIAVQVQKCREWCEAQNLPVLDIFADEAVSGMKKSRPQYDRMMRQLYAGGADTVVIYDQSRMFRKVTYWFQFREQIASIGVRVISVTQPTIGGDLRDPMVFVSEGTMAIMGEMWVLQTRQKVIAKMRYMAKEGIYTGGVPPLGYRVEDRRLVIDEPEAETVRRIFSSYASGMTYREIIAGLNADGIRTKRGSPFGSNSLHDLLKNEKYIGNLVYWKTERREDGKRNTHRESDDVMRIEHALPAIIDIETWEKVQQRMADNKKEQAGRPARVRKYPLKGKVFCAECKCAMCVDSAKKKYFYYRCSGQKRTGLCGSYKIPVEELEGRVADAVRALLGEPENLDNLLLILRCERGQLVEDAARRMSFLLDRRTEITQQLENGTRAILSGLHSETLTAQMHALEAEASELDREMAAMKHAADAACFPDEQLRSLLESAKNDLQALLSLVIRVEVGTDSIRIWTLLDADPTGRFDFTDEGIKIDQFDNSWCRWSVTHNYQTISLSQGLLILTIPRKKNRG